MKKLIAVIIAAAVISGCSVKTVHTKPACTVTEPNGDHHLSWDARGELSPTEQIKTRTCS